MNVSFQGQPNLFLPRSGCMPAIVSSYGWFLRGLNRLPSGFRAGRVAARLCHDAHACITNIICQPEFTLQACCQLARASTGD